MSSPCLFFGLPLCVFPKAPISVCLSVATWHHPELLCIYSFIHSFSETVLKQVQCLPQVGEGSSRQYKDEHAQDTVPTLEDLPFCQGRGRRINRLFQYMGPGVMGWWSLIVRHLNQSLVGGGGGGGGGGGKGGLRETSWGILESPLPGPTIIRKPQRY